MSTLNRSCPGQATRDVSERERFGREVSRRAAAEGMVLLENSAGLLPLKPGAKLAVFGMGARHTIKGGTGSGDVNSRDVVSVEPGLRAAGFDIVNGDYLDAFDAAYGQAREEWIRAIYAATEGKKEYMKLYNAHASLPLVVPELPLPLEACAGADACIYVISRVSGESADRFDRPGDYYLSETERRELEAISSVNRNLIVLLNIGGPIDLNFVKELQIPAVLMMSQPGADGGHAAADVLSGKVNPSGRLTDTYAAAYADYPSSAGFSHNNGNLIEEYYTDGIYVGYRYFDTFGVRPLYPFGFGLSYTAFTEEAVSVRAEGSEIRVRVRVKNVGERAGRRATLLFAACPASEQKKEAKRLAAFGKTKLLAPGEEETLELRFDLYSLASYRPAQAAYVLEKGVYTLLLAEHAERFTAAARLVLSETTTVAQLTNVCELLDALKEIEPTADMISRRDALLGALPAACPDVCIDGAARLMAARACEKPAPRIDEALLARAKAITAGLTDEEKMRMVVGAPSVMASEIIGAAAVTVPGAAGETVTLPERGIPKMVLADGPAGVRIQQRFEINPESGEIYRLDRFETLENRFFGKLASHEGAISRYQFATAIPVGTLLAQSFDPALLEEVGEMIGGELEEFGVAVWLAPGMNIHRNPLCGRNFEYYSEDPLVSGVMAAAITRGVQKRRGLGVSIKHFACNNQEDNRFHMTAIVSERALRELYLKGFEIAVKTADPLTIMTSYNRVNSVHTANSYDLCTTVARGEWGFSGFIMTDWTTTNSGHGSSAVKCITAGNDLIMPGTDSDRREILDAIYGIGNLALPMEKLDACVTRIVCAALAYGER